MKSLLSKIENGRTMPPVATLIKIAGSLGIRVSDLLDEGGRVETVLTVSAVSHNQLIQTNKGYSFYTFAPDYKRKTMQPFLFVARKDLIKQHVLSHEGHEFINMLEGVMKYKVGPIEYTLKSGDSLYFDSLDEHAVTPITEEVKYLAVFTDSISSE
jgi:DNA-binding XRE family transcriptional regulator